MNISTDRRHPFHTYNDRNRFRQFGFTQQNIVVDTDDVLRDMKIWNGKGSLRYWCLGYSQCFSVISRFCSTSKLACFWAFFHRLPLECRNHWEALTVAEASMSQWPLSIRDFPVSLHVVYVDYDDLLCESKLPESIVVVIGIQGMMSVRRNVYTFSSSFCR